MPFVINFLGSQKSERNENEFVLREVQKSFGPQPFYLRSVSSSQPPLVVVRFCFDKLYHHQRWRSAAFIHFSNSFPNIELKCWDLRYCRHRSHLFRFWPPNQKHRRTYTNGVQKQTVPHFCLFRLCAQMLTRTQPCLSLISLSFSRIYHLIFFDHSLRFWQVLLFLR